MATIFTDNFNSYNDGDLNGQGSWVKNSGTITVQGTTVREGAKAITISGGANYTKIGSSTSDGVMTYYVKAPSSGVNCGFVIQEGATDLFAFSLGITGTGTADFYGGGSWRKQGDINANEWNTLQIEWRSSDKKARYQLNEAGWSDWYSGLNNFSSGADRMYFGIDNGITVYYDYLGEDLIAAGPADLKSANGVAIADIKSINTVAIADVKSVNGIT